MTGKNELNSKQRAAAIALAGGAARSAVAAELAISDRTLAAWLQRDDFLAVVNEATGRMAMAAAPMAQQVLIRQLADSNPWVAQSAAREVLRQAQTASGAAAATVTVQFEAMPVPAMPAALEDDGR